jgi:hypothetical protein
MLKISVNRNQFVAIKLGSLKGETILDLGCRDQILRNYLNGRYNYIGVDLIQLNKKKTLVCNLEQGLPSFKKKVDIIVALDVLEHLDNAHLIRDQILKTTQKKIVIALPNMAYYKFRINFLLKGVLSRKYPFNYSKPLDRHKWIPNYYNIDNFFSKVNSNVWKIKKINFIAHKRFNIIFYYLEKFFSYLFPNLFVYERIYILERIK